MHTWLLSWIRAIQIQNTHVQHCEGCLIPPYASCESVPSLLAQSEVRPWQPDLHHPVAEHQIETSSATV